VPTPPVWAYNSLEPFEVNMVDSLKRTSLGSSKSPGWILKQCSVELASVSDILNLSFSTGILPAQWLTSIVTPIPKVSQPEPINVSDPYNLCHSHNQSTNREIRCETIHCETPCIKASDISNQITFRLNGSSATALTRQFT